jgi:hypothetical protein
MSGLSECQIALSREVEHWSKMPCEQLVSELRDIREYQVEVGANRYQVEVQLLENTERYVHVSVAVDDFSFRRSLVPLSTSFVKQKDQ